MRGGDWLARAPRADVLCPAPDRAPAHRARSRPPRGGQGRGRAGAARDWQARPARSRAQLRARARPPAGGRWEAGGMASAGRRRPASEPACGGRASARRFPSRAAVSSRLPRGGPRAGKRAGEPRLRAHHGSGSPRPPRRRLFLRRGRAGSRGARSAPCRWGPRGRSVRTQTWWESPRASLHVQERSAPAYPASSPLDFGLCPPRLDLTCFGQI